MRVLDPQVIELVRDLQSDQQSPRAGTTLMRRRDPLVDSAEQLRTLNELPLAAEFDQKVGSELTPMQLDIFQVNLGKLCNMTCRHCHVDAGPDRTDAMMNDATIEQVIAKLRVSNAHTVDITGGAPELHPRFRDLVDAAVTSGKHVLDRCNLTVLLLPRNNGLIEWFAERGVEVVASLPHFRKPNTDAQRGDGVFEKSIRALHRLNAAGYGLGDPRRRLTLVSNPAGAFLNGAQASIEREWKDALARNFGIHFDRLFALNNMPISRFLEWLRDSGNLEQYMQKLLDAFNPVAVAGLMCRNTLSIAWDGRLYDCDFNQMLDMPLAGSCGTHISQFDEAQWRKRQITTARHCFGCTAGAGSSCGGQTA
jgi:radical SAM/Cys-rich protein